MKTIWAVPGVWLNGNAPASFRASPIFASRQLGLKIGRYYGRELAGIDHRSIGLKSRGSGSGSEKKFESGRRSRLGLGPTGTGWRAALHAHTSSPLPVEGGPSSWETETVTVL